MVRSCIFTHILWGAVYGPHCGMRPGEGWWWWWWGVTNDQENVWNTNMLSFKSSGGTGESEQCHRRTLGHRLIAAGVCFHPKHGESEHKLGKSQMAGKLMVVVGVEWRVLLVLRQQPVEVILPLFQHVPKILLKKHEGRRWEQPTERREGRSADNQQLHPPLTRPCWLELYKNRTNWNNWICTSNNESQTSYLFFFKDGNGNSNESWFFFFFFEKKVFYDICCGAFIEFEHDHLFNRYCAGNYRNQAYYINKYAGVLDYMPD